jgi:predicted RNase H-like nuclease (RuvC/YqgF family)
MPEFQLPTVPEQQPIPQTASAAASTTTQSPMKTRAVAKCTHCREKNMALRSCIQAKEPVRQKHFLEIRDLKRRLQPIWKLNATIERRNKTIQSLKEEIKDLKRMNSRLTKTEVNSKKKAKEAKEERAKVEKKFKRREQKMKRDLTMEFEDALTQAMDKTLATDLEKDGRAHSDLMRMVVYSCLDSNTPVGQVRNLLLRLSPILNLNLAPADIPVQSTVSIMALELRL